MSDGLGGMRCAMIHWMLPWARTVFTVSCVCVAGSLVMSL